MCFCYLHRINGTGYLGAESGEEPLDVDHQEFLSAHKDLTFAAVNSLYDFACGLIGGASSGLTGIHLGVLLSVFLKCVERYACLDATGAYYCYAYVILVILGLDGLKESVQGVLG